MTDDYSYDDVSSATGKSLPRFAVVKGQRPEDVAGEMANRIKELIWEYEGRCTLATAVGVLHIVAAELVRDAHD